MQQATFGAGCFWGVQYTFNQMKGVTKTTVGYMGGSTDNPSYEEVCSDKTGHAEVVHIEFDETLISYEELLTIFWKIHDPTQKNRQGLDVGSQYRSVIFYHSEKQRSEAVKSKEELDKSGKYKRPIVTEIVAASKFYPAENYHQNYFEKHGATGCPV